MKKFKRKNILYIYTDQQRLDTLSIFGGKAISTPNIDSIGHEGVACSKYFVQNPVCSPSRMSFLTGRYCSSLGVATNGIKLPSDAVPVHQILKQYNYKTAQIGKLHFDPHAKRDHKDPTDTYGFDTFILSDEPGCYDDAYTKWVEKVAPDQLDKVRTALPPAALFWDKPEYSFVPRNTHEPYVFEADDDLSHSAFVSSQVCQYLEEYSSEQPFFLIAGFYAPHTPVTPPQSCIDRVDVSKIELPVVGKDEKVQDFLQGLSEEDWIKIRTYYLALTLHVDDCVGEILDTLKKTGKYDDTIIIFTSDHGEYLGDHGRIQKDMPAHDCISNVPFLMKNTGEIAPDTMENNLIEAVDVVPTVLDYIGIQSPRYVQGKSLVPLFSGKTDEHKNSVLIEFFNDATLQETAVRTKDYFYFCSSTKELLYDCNKDPNQVNNVVNEPEYANILSDLRREMILRVQRASYKSNEIIDAY